MDPIDLDEYETELEVRQLTAADVDRVVELSKLCFPGMEPWEREHIESQLAQFPEGQLGVEFEGELVATASSLIVEYETYSDWHDWEEIADGGYIRNHDPDGDTLYGIELMVHPGYRGLRLSRRLYDERKRLCRELDLERIVIAGRIPGYHRHADRLSASEYVEEVVAKSLVDPVLTAQLSNGFDVRGLIPEYLDEDAESRGYATYLEWVNLEHRPQRRAALRAVANVRIAVVQYQLRPIDSFEDFARQSEFFVDTAAEYRSDFALFPELFTTQLLSCVPGQRPGQAARTLAEFTPRYLDLFRGLAIRYNVNVVGGSQFTVEDGRLLNVSFLFRRDGTIERQSKVHITPAERKWWGVEPGEGVAVFDTDRGKVAILICYDVEFPELARIAAGMGAEILFVPFNTDERSAYLRVRMCAQARAIENEVYVAISGCVGNLPFVENADIHYAQSGIFTPSSIAFARDGVAGECTPGEETMVIRDVDLEQLHRERAGGPVQNWRDRRTDLYRLTYLGDDEARDV